MKQFNEQQALNEKLDQAFRQYRDVCGSPEPGPNFMPGIWARIEDRQRSIWSFRRMAQAFVMAGAAACLLIGGLLVSPLAQQADPHSYVEVLAEEQSPDRLLFQDIALRDQGADFRPAIWEESR